MAVQSPLTTAGEDVLRADDAGLTDAGAGGQPVGGERAVGRQASSARRTLLAWLLLDVAMIGGLVLLSRRSWRNPTAGATSWRLSACSESMERPFSP